MQLLILAGGLGTRIRTVAGDLPKALVPARGVPFIDYQLAWIADQGIRDVVIAIGHRGEAIREAVGDGSRWGLTVAYANEGDRLRGTAGAVRHAIELGLLGEEFLVQYGDSYLPIDYAPVIAAFAGTGRPLMTVMGNRGRWDRSNIRYAPGAPILYDKRNPDPAAAGLDHIDYGLIGLPRAFIIERIPAGEIADLADTLGDASRQGLVDGFEVDQRFYEVGSPEGLRDFEAWVEANRPPLAGLEPKN